MKMVRNFSKVSYLQFMATLVVIGGICMIELARYDVLDNVEKSVLAASFLMTVGGLVGIALAVIRPVFAKMDALPVLRSGSLGGVFESASIMLLLVLVKSQLFQISEHLFILLEIVFLTFLSVSLAFLLISISVTDAPSQQPAT